MQTDGSKQFVHEDENVKDFLDKLSEIENKSMTEEEKETLERRKEFINNLSPKYRFKYGIDSEYTPGLTKPSLNKRTEKRRKKNKQDKKMKRKQRK